MKNKKTDRIWAVAFISELGIPRMIVGEKKDKEKMEDFVNERAIKKINETPINKFDKISKYTPLIGVEIDLNKVFDSSVVKEQKPSKIGDKGYKSPVKEEDLAEYLKDNGWVCYKKKSKN